MDADGGTAEEYDRLDKIDGVLKRRAESRRNNPFGDPVLSPSARPLNMNDMGEMGMELEARMAASDAARENNPDFGTALMRPEEAEQFTSMIGKATPAQIPAVLGSLYKASGEKVYRRVMEQVGVKDPVIASAGIRFAVDMKAGRPPTVAVGIVKGRALLTAKDKDGKKIAVVAMPPDKVIGDSFDTSMGQFPGLYANRPNDFRNDLQSVKAFYANATAEAGDVSGEFNQKRWNESIQAVLGEPIDIEGTKVFTPPGMDAERFELSATRQIAKLAKQYDLNTGFLAPDIGLRNVEGKPGYYYLVNDEGAMLKDKDGNLIGVNLNE